MLKRACSAISLPWVPGEGAAQLGRQGGDGIGQGAGDDVGGVAAGPANEHHEPALALDEVGEGAGFLP